MFSTYLFYPKKKPRKYYRQFDKSIYNLKNLKNYPKTQNQPENKNLTKIIYVFVGNFKVKNSFNMTLLIKKKEVI